MLYENIQEREELTLHAACTVLQVSTHAYQHWLHAPQEKTNPLIQKIKTIAGHFPRYGYRRITAQLQRKGFTVNHKKVLKTLKEHGLTCKLKKRYKPYTTNSKHGFHIYPNLIKNLTVSKLNQVWISDITYVYLKNTWIYLAVILDKFSRKCIGWNLSRNPDTELCLNALHQAIHTRKKLGLKDLIHHSDRGVQYASHNYTQLLKENNIQISMSARGNAYDNAHCESFIKTIKYDEVYMNEYKDFNDACQNIEKFIEQVYNKKRLHSSLGYKPPAEFEQQILKGGAF